MIPTLVEPTLLWTRGCWLVTAVSTTAIPALPERSARDLGEALYAEPSLFESCGTLP